MLKRALQNGPLLIGLSIILIFVFLALFPWLVALYNPLEIHPGQSIVPPSTTYWLGTDKLGRDIFSRVIYASRPSLLMALGSVVVALVVGVPLGLSAGYFGGLVDALTMRVLDAIQSFPILLFAILVLAFLGQGVVTLIPTIGLIYVPVFARLTRGNTLALKSKEFVEASRAIGAPSPHILFRVILPNCLTPITVQISLALGVALLVEAALSFLGLGVQPPTPAWGSMLQNAQAYVRIAPWYMLAPGFCIFILILAFNLMGDGLREVIDPKLYE